MNNKVALAKEVGKTAAYVFVLGGLFVTTTGQFDRMRAAFNVVFKK